MKTVPLHGKNARGRVALVDDDDYELVMQYRWYVTEKLPSTPTGRGSGPYAKTAIGHGRSDRGTIQMHCLIMGLSGVDHRDHNGLNNQRSNLRPANQSQNNANQRPQMGRLSRFKGVTFFKPAKLWTANVKLNGKRHGLGYFVSELEAAYAYDAAARRLFGEYAFPNFPEGPTQAMRDEWAAEVERRRAAAYPALSARATAALAAAQAERSENPTTTNCVVCGREYEYRSFIKSLYCSNACSCRMTTIRRQEREGKPPVVTCVVCGTEVQPKKRRIVLYCGERCRAIDRRRKNKAAAEAEAAGRLF